MIILLSPPPKIKGTPEMVLLRAKNILKFTEKKNV